jgi:N-acetylglucosamine-6-phosphate deacetylase
MTTQVILADRALTPHEEIADAVLVVRDGKIVQIGPRRAVTIPPDAQVREARGMTLVPGFVDVHIHGAAGHDVMEAIPESLAAIASFAASHGTTSLVATTVTASKAETCRAAAGIAAWMRAEASRSPAGPPRAEILGIHFEGPFISPARRGVHPPQWIAAPNVALLDEFLSAADGAARILTLAPELPGALDLIARTRAAGVVVSLGHTDATFAQASDAIAHGARHAAHVFNAMRPFAHRETGVLGAVLTAPEVTAELIADGVHVDDAAIRILLAAKGPRGVLLVSDGTSATGMPDGRYRLGTADVTVSGGIPRNTEGKLAGSTLTLDRALRHMLALGIPLPDALAMLTVNPARLLGLEGRKGALAPGADADLVLLDAQMRVASVFTRGFGFTA